MISCDGNLWLHAASLQTGWCPLQAKETHQNISRRAERIQTLAQGMDILLKPHAGHDYVFTISSMQVHRSIVDYIMSLWYMATPQEQDMWYSDCAHTVQESCLEIFQLAFLIS